MKDNNILNLSIESSAFDALKRDFDKVLKRTIGNMQVKESEEATLTLKLSILLKEIEVPNYESDDPAAMRTVHKPQFDHKVSSVMQIKTEESGKFKGEYELVWDEEQQDFVMKPIENGQMSFDDDYATGEPEGNPYDEDDVRALPPADVYEEEEVYEEDEWDEGYEYDEPEGSEV